MSDAPATKYYYRQRQQNRLYDAVIRAIEEEGVRRKFIAEKLGIPPSQVTRLLSGPANWTVDTVSDLLFAIDAELDFQIVRFRDRAQGNRFHPVGEQARPIIMGGQTGTTSSGSVSIIYNPLPYDPTKPAEVHWKVGPLLPGWPNA